MRGSNGYAVGIDFGTSNTVALVRWPDGRTRPVLFDGQPILASAVFLDDHGVLRVGRDAQRLAQLDRAHYEPNPKRRVDDGHVLLGDRELAVPDLLAAPLTAVARAVHEAVGHLPPAVVTYPVGWGQARRAVLHDAAARAGWRQVELVAEPVAAARYLTVALGRPVPPGGVLAVFDFGGGTLDLALVRNAVDEMESVLRRGGLDARALSGVFLVGGASRVPLVSRMLHARLGIAPTVPDQPELPVAEGALLASARPPSNDRPPAALTPVTVPFDSRPAPAPPDGAAPRPHRGPLPMIVLSTLLVLALLGVAGVTAYKLTRPDPTFRAARVERTTRIDGLAPDGLRQSLLSETKAFAVGERTDGGLTVVTVDLKTGAEVVHRPATAAGWQKAELIGNWVVVTSKPAADGRVTVAFANGSDDIHAAHVLGSGDQLVPRFAGADTPELKMFLLSPARQWIRTMTVGRGGVNLGEAHPLAAGLRPANRMTPDPPLNLILNLVDDGKLFSYTGLTAPSPSDLEPVTPGLLFWTGTGDLRGPADRKPVWLGPCGRDPEASLPDTYFPCVIDEIPGRPETREVAIYRKGDALTRAAVPHADPGDWLVETGGYVLVPTKDGVMTVAPNGETASFRGRLWPTGYQAVVNVAGDGASTRVTGIDLKDDLRTAVGNPVVRSAGCAALANRLACPGDDGFTVWVVGTRQF